MKRKLCSVLLALCMVLTLLPVSALAEDGTLQSQIDAIETTGTVTLDKSYTEDISIPAGKTITLDLNGQTLTNSSGDTITVALGAELTIKGDGTVDNVTHGKADIYNNGTVTLSGGRYTRSREADNSIDSSGGNSYYNILNHGEMTINKGVSLISSGHFSSLIASGYYNYTAVEKGERTAYISATGNAEPKLTINGGTFSGGINTIKNDDNATLIINDGTFSNVTQDVIQNNNIATINGGTFNADGYNAFENRYYKGGYNAGQLTVTNGNFIGNLLSGNGATTSISGGAFTDLANAVKYATDGATIKLAGDTATTEQIDTEKNLTLDLNGKTLTGTTSGVTSTLSVTGAVLTIKDSSASKTGKIDANEYGIMASESGTVIIDGGTVTSQYASLAGNNTLGDMNFEVNGGTLTSALSEAIYMPGQVSLTVTNGVINGGISVRMGQINISGGTINGMTAEQAPDSMSDYWNHSGSAWIGDAIYIWGGTYSSQNSQYGNSANITITGGTINGKAHNAIAIYDIGNNYDQTVTVTVSGNATVSGPVTIDATYGPKTHKVDATISLSAGTYSSDPTAYVADTHIARKDSDTKFTVVLKKDLTSGVYMNNPADFLAPGYVSYKNSDDTYTVYYPVPVTPGNTSSSTTKNPDGSTTTTTTDKTTGTVTETTKNPDGSTTTVETRKDGSVTETNKTAGGSVGTVKSDANGNSEISANISAADVSAAAKKNEPVAAPVSVAPAASPAAAPVIKLSVPASAGEVSVVIPVTNAQQGTVAIKVNPDGTEEIIKTSVVTKDGVVLGVKGSTQIKIVNNDKDFADTVGHWAESDVDFVSARELFTGTAPQTFSPESATTRGMVVTVLARLAGESTDGGANWYDKGCAWAVTNGVSDGTDPNGTVTREQLAAMLYRYFGSPAVSGSLSFADASSVSEYAHDAMQWCVNNGIINGMDGLLNPQGQATRAQVSAMFARYIHLAATK